MKKPAPTDHEIHPLLRDRWSPRAFGSDPVSDDELDSMIEAARWAPSCFNDQPWRFVVARREDGPAFEAILECLVEGNRPWARSAGMLMISVVARSFEHNGRPNAWAEHDLGLASMQFVLQAEALGLRAHMMAGFDRDRAREVLAIPQGFDPHVAFAVGRPGDPAQLDEALRQREGAARNRKPATDILFHGRWTAEADAD